MQQLGNVFGQTAGQLFQHALLCDSAGNRFAFEGQVMAAVGYQLVGLERGDLGIAPIPIAAHRKKIGLDAEQVGMLSGIDLDFEFERGLRICFDPLRYPIA